MTGRSLSGKGAVARRNEHALRPRVAALVLTSLLVAACVESDSGVTSVGELGEALPATLAIVSDPAGGAPGSVVTGGPAAATVGEFIFVSLPPGAIADGTEIVVANDARAFLTTIELVDGGFDPVPVPGSAGETIEFNAYSGGTRIVRWREEAPLSSPPVVVRTSPSSGKRDVPVALSPLVVFSEPMDPTTLDVDAIQLLRDGNVVRGSIEVAADLLSAVFRPDDALAPNTTYVLSVGSQVADLDGESLARTEYVDFTTAMSSVSDLSVTYERETPHTEAGRDSRYVIHIDGSFELLDWTGSDTTRYTGRSVAASALWQFDIDRGSPIALYFDGYGNPGCAIGGIDGFGGFFVDGHLGVTYCAELHQAGLEAGLYTSVPDTGPGAPPPQAGQIAFARDGRIHLANTDGSGVVPLSAGPADRDPAWSPDGSRLAFTSATGSTTGVFVMDADGGNVVQRAVSGEQPTWSPDGQWIAYQCLGYSGGICRVRADGSSATSDSVYMSIGQTATPAWSPDGTRIAFMSDHASYDISFDIWVVAPDGSQLAALSTNRHESYQPAWSPDGQRVAFVSCEWSFIFCSASAVSVMSATGSDVVHLVAASGFAHPTWSPDGQLIAFGSAGSIEWVSADGSQRGTILDDGHSPAWRP